MRACLSLVFLFLLNGAFSNAEDVFDLAEQYNQKKNKVTFLESRQRAILSQIYSIEKETNKLVTQKSEVDEQKIKLDGELANLSKKIVEVETEIESILPELVERMAFTDQVNSLPWFYTFLTSQTLMDLDILFETATHINNQESEKIVRFLELVKDMSLKKKELNQTALKIVELRKEIRMKESRISKNENEKKTSLKRLGKLISTEKKVLNRIKGQGKKAVAKSEFKNLGLLFGSSFFDQKGELPHPIAKPIRHSYGLNKQLAKDQVQLIHKGYFYKAKADEAVTSVAAGKIRFSGPLEGYGQVVVVDHGSHYYSLYANLSKSDRRVGEEVRQGEALGHTGFQHLQFNTGLYFEIRHFSQPQNPLSWLRPRGGNLATL